MPDAESGADDMLLRRLRESASGEETARQLRRRYDMLRTDYEDLLDRLGELQGRLRAASSETAQQAPPEPQPGPSSQQPTVKMRLSEHLVQPLIALREEYLDAIGGIQTIVNGLDALAATPGRGLQRQHTTHAAPATVPVPSAVQPREGPRTVQVETQGTGFGELLDFQEQLAGLRGVARVSIHSIDSERATFVVELDKARS
jgi:hypothetical protein